ncbi:MAG TPA: cupin domain-containing protein [Thermoleophilaceae bacterium]|nr:cupin domain-containing protein [Thermoleophilaceae bacterium]
MPEHQVEDPVFRCRYRFERATGADGREVQRIEMWVDPGGGVTPHIHPTMDERFEVIGGTAQFLAGRRWITAGPGESVDVPAGTRHAFRNRGDEVAHVMAEATPPSSLQAFLEDVAGLSRAGKLTRIGLPSPSGLLEAAVLIDAYSDMVELLWPAPPRPLQRLIVPPLARFAAKRGRRAGEFAALA